MKCCSVPSLTNQIQGCDIKDVEEVIQYGIPTSLDIWVQQAGCVGQLEMINAQAILFIEPSVFKTKKSLPLSSQRRAATVRLYPSIFHQTEKLTFFVCRCCTSDQGEEKEPTNAKSEWQLC